MKRPRKRTENYHHAEDSEDSGDGVRNSDGGDDPAGD